MEDSEIQMVASRVDSAVDWVNDSRSPLFSVSTPFHSSAEVEYLSWSLDFELGQ